MIETTKKIHPQLTFKNIDHAYLKTCFIEAYERFHTLHNHLFVLEQVPLANYTMRAQPIVNGDLFSPPKRHYKIQISDHFKIREYIRIEELPSAVLIGWFAHELGHIQDYQQRSAVNLVWYLICYLMSSSYRKTAERAADCYAIELDFGDQLMQTKQFILKKSGLPKAYIRRIEQFYMSPDELEAILLEKKKSASIL